MSTSESLLLVTRLLSAIDVALRIAGNNQKLRDLVAAAVAEGRDLSPAELNQLRADAQAAIDRLGA